MTTTKQLGNIVKESSFLTAKTSAIVCWLFVGSGIFSVLDVPSCRAPRAPRMRPAGPARQLQAPDAECAAPRLT